MKKFVIKYLIYLVSIIVVLSTLELLARKNDKSVIHIRKQYLDDNKSEIEGIVFGPSHMARAMNPKYLDNNVAVLALGGSAPNLDYLLYEYSAEITKPKFLIFDLSYGYLYRYNSGEQLSETKLSYYYPNIKKQGISDYFMLKYPFEKEVLNIYQENSSTDIDKWGFENSVDKIDVFKPLGYQEKLILKDRKTENRIKEHNGFIDDVDSKKNYETNTKLYKKIVEACASKNIKVIFINTPKYHLYNHSFLQDQELIKEHRAFLSEVIDNKTSFYFDFSDKFEKDVNLFYNVNHMNIEGAKTFTKEVNKIIHEVVN